MANFIFKIIMIFLLIGLVWSGFNVIESFIDLKDHEAISTCKMFEESGYNISFEKNSGFDKCYIVEDGEKLTKKDYYNKHKYDDLLGDSE